MRELTAQEVAIVAGGSELECVAAGLAAIGLGVAVVGTAGLATVPVGLVAAFTAGELTVAAAGVALAGAGGVLIGTGAEGGSNAGPRRRRDS